MSTSRSVRDQQQTAQDVLVLQAQLQEAEALVETLRQRTVLLNVEVRGRDAQIAGLRAELDEACKQLTDQEQTDAKKP